MKTPVFALIIAMSSAIFSGISEAANCDTKASSALSKCEMIPYQTSVSYPVTSIFGNSPDKAVVKASIRAGFFRENLLVPFRGNVIYFEGLADSMLNHRPLFNKLVAQGFRVIAFDYMGQGGSTGSMNDTRISDIPKLGNLIYKKYARDFKTFPKPMIIGWSTGGLAAYLSAIDNSASKVVLIAPGMAPKVILGEHNFWELDFDIITQRTLTSKKYAEAEINPHVDGIKPRSPLVVKDFASDLIFTSLSVRNSMASTKVAGLVLLSGSKDTYVKTNQNSIKLKKLAPHFKQVMYPMALHEIDNEIDSISNDSHNQVINFLKK